MPRRSDAEYFIILTELFKPSVREASEAFYIAYFCYVCPLIPQSFLIYCACQSFLILFSWKAYIFTLLKCYFCVNIKRK